jgi:UDP-GlcNAc3NAcA epimerase
MKIIHIVGNRPQFIKLALLQKALQAKNTENIILHTGQHFDANMSAVFFDELQIPPPSYSLDINNLSHNEMIGEMLLGIDPILNKEKPACVIVYGDTNTTLAGALAAKKRSIPVAHVEAGIRTMDEQMPEESNRYITDRISTLNFCCTYLGVENLEKEGFLSGRIHSGVYHSGDLMLDTSIFYKDVALKKEKKIGNLNPEHPFVLATIHRAENTGNETNLKNIIAALNNIHHKTRVVFPMHPNTKMKIEQLKLKTEFTTCDALGYLDMLALVQKSQSVITDSGGLSREAFFFNKPTLVLMQNPFWPEIFIHGNCMRANAVTKEIETDYQKLLSSDKPFERTVFGEGHAAKNITDILLQYFSHYSPLKHK